MTDVCKRQKLRNRQLYKKNEMLPQVATKAIHSGWKTQIYCSFFLGGGTAVVYNNVADILFSTKPFRTKYGCRSAAVTLFCCSMNSTSTAFTGYSMASSDKQLLIFDNAMIRSQWFYSCMLQFGHCVVRCNGLFRSHLVFTCVR